MVCLHRLIYRLPPINTTFLLVRHGETEWNAKRRLQGQLDSPLTPVGIEQMEWLASQLAETPDTKAIDHIISSPLARTQSSAVILQKKLQRPLSIKHALKERSFGIWEGKLFDAIKHEPTFKKVFFEITETSIEQGESAIEARQRMQQSLAQLAVKYRGQRLLVVTHGEILRCFLSGIDNSMDGSAYQLFKNGKVFQVVYNLSQQSFKLLTY